ncbi:hypothetical protein LPJ78_002566 [Coemansia sp. RSA 989]|nr:hypothetical protein LPJ68_004947 [Coemansia sp. RSA 1086]KAJ1747589.1 hypothetical protein LPJ79_005143 [Coemansia sp. RSA 1821]KAJ1865637.1 hypothetical protein LPJ78_002566 [Coemansia sp. RSA 989]KAJ1872822.1 hypothetical protein LPJ55_002819 [Coemansia sp. RSA 990]KAJ2631340.1 hypothetical protein H4R22_002047 [Coemansia sp. RSA 1290]KAJ2648041.1 hypothetical protein IWW40_004245 [Coemansia sp. RSA 1250]KAJ2672733.1 hypothetical protein IWW42_002686 [Coemansia sp. RSA 1085]
MAFGQRNINDAYLWTCEKDARVAQTAINNISASGFKDKVSVIVDSADTVLSEWDVNNKLDLIFMDANKSAYKRYYDIIMDRELLHSHGQIIVDNVLFHGKVHPHTSQTTQGKSGIAAKLHEFNKHVASDTRSSQVILPLFDGLMLISKA